MAGPGGHDKQLYECELEFYKPIDNSTVKKHSSGRCVSFSAKKKETGPYWPRLLKTDKKCHFVKIDFNRWKDEDEPEDSDVETDFGYSDMMNKVTPYEDFEEEPPEENEDEERVHHDDPHGAHDDIGDVESTEQPSGSSAKHHISSTNEDDGDDKPQLRRRKKSNS